MKDRIRIETTVSTAFANEVKEQAELECFGKVSEYAKKALKFYRDFGVKNGYIEKIRDAAEKEKRTPHSLVTAILETYFDKVRYFKTFE